MRFRVRSGWVWTTWIVGIPLLAIVGFAIPEYLAMQDEQGLTLSQFLYTLFEQNPLLLFWTAFLGGALVGGLSVHVFWHWVPAEKRATCGQCCKTILLN